MQPSRVPVATGRSQLRPTGQVPAQPHSASAALVVLILPEADMSPRGLVQGHREDVRRAVLRQGWAGTIQVGEAKEHLRLCLDMQVRGSQGW